MHALALALAVMAGLQDAAGASPRPLAAIPGFDFVCDRAVECGADVCRDQHSMDFLCCEGGAFLPSHFLNPMLGYMFVGDAQLALLGVLFSEVVEHTLATLSPGFRAYVFGGENGETLAGALFGDALLSGGAGIYAGFLIMRTFGVAALSSTPARASAVGRVGRRRVYVVTYTLFGLATAFLPMWEAEDGGVRYGLALYGVAVLGLLWGGFYWRFGRLPSDDALVWTRGDGTVVPRSARARMFGAASALVVLAVVPHVWGPAAQPLFSVNEWFMFLAVVGPGVAVLSVVAVVRFGARREWHNLLHALTGALAVGGVLALAAFAGGGRRNSAFAYLGALCLAGGVLTFLGGELLAGDARSPKQGPPCAKPTPAARRRP